MFKTNLQFFAEETEQQNTENNDTTAESKNADNDSKTIPYERFKQVNEQRKQLEQRIAEYEKAEEERKKAEMTEQERLSAEKEEAERKAKEAEERAEQALKSANERLLKSEFKSLARSKDFGIREDALEDAFLLTDLSNVKITEDGKVEGLTDTLNALKESKAYLFNQTSYADPSPGAGKSKKDLTESNKVRLQNAAEKARKSGNLEDRIEYTRLKRELTD